MHILRTSLGSNFIGSYKKEGDNQTIFSTWPKIWDKNLITYLENKMSF